jgi:hypothetical protein
MSDGYYIYLDRRDVGKGDLYFVQWGKSNDKPDKSIPIFSHGERRMIFKDKDMADKTAEKIASMYQGFERILHVEPCEEATFDD